MKMKKIMSAGVLIMMSLSLAACGNNEEKKEKEPENIPTIDSITLGEDHKDLTASIKVLTNRTDIVDTDRKSTRLNSSHLKLSRMPSSA